MQSLKVITRIFLSGEMPMTYNCIKEKKKEYLSS